jgi:hypothetical protein
MNRLPESRLRLLRHRAARLASIVLPAFLLGCEGSAPIKVEPVQAVVTDKDLTGLWMKDDGTEGWAVGEEGTILRFESGRWANAEPLRWGKSGRFNDLSVGPGGTGLAVGTDGVIAQLAEEKWSIDVQLGEHDPLVDHFTERREQRSGRRVELAETFDLAYGLAGLTPFMDLEAVWADRDGEGAWIAGGSGGLLRYDRWSGVRAFKASGLQVNDLWINRDGTEGWAVGTFRPPPRQGRSEEGGPVEIALAHYDRERGWELWRQRSGRRGAGVAIAMAPEGQEGWAVGDEGSVFHFEKNRWRYAFSVEEPLNEVWAHPGHTEAWAVGSKGTVFLFWGGGPWLDFKTTDKSINAIWLNPEGSEGWAVGDAGTILHIEAHTLDTML